MAKLALNDCLQTQVFRKIVQIYRDNPILRRTIKPTSWFVWDGRSDMKDDPFIQGNLPAIRLTPAAQPARPLTNVRFEANFLIRQEIAVSGFNMDDIMNLWFTMHTTIFTGDGNRAVLQALSALSLAATPPGQNIVQVGMGMPAFTPHMDALGSEMILADGDIAIQMLIPR